MSKEYRFWPLAAALCLSLASAVTVLLAAVPVEGRSAPEERPNIVFVMTNDQSPNTIDHMPFLRNRMRPKGLTFPNATFNFPLCCPSRTSMLRGQYTHNHGIWENQAIYGGGYGAWLEKGLQRSTFPSWLARSGYRTGGFGLYVNEWSRGRHGNPKGFHFYRGLTEDWDRARISELNARDTSVKDNAITWLRQNINADPGGKGEAPIFMWVSFFAPHSPYPSDPAYAERFTSTPLPDPPSFNEVDVSDKPSPVQGVERFTDSEIEQLTEDHRNRLRGTLTADDALRGITQVLRDSGELDNSYIVFWTDNGSLMGEHRLLHKNWPYLEALSFPMVVRGPGVREGATDNRIVMNQDIAPTFADIADAAVPAFVDGRSFLPILDGPGQSASWRDVGAIEGWSAHNPAVLPRYRGIRDEKYVYVEYETGEKEYYDLVADPHQLDNAYASLPEARKDELEGKAAQLATCARQSCRTAEGTEGAP